MIGGRAKATLRVVAEHADLWNIPGGDIADLWNIPGGDIADLWNIPGGDIADAMTRSALVDQYCTEIGRDPAAITRSIFLSASYDAPRATRDAVREAIDAGFRHIVLGLSAPYPMQVAR